MLYLKIFSRANKRYAKLSESESVLWVTSRFMPQVEPEVEYEQQAYKSSTWSHLYVACMKYKDRFKMYQAEKANEKQALIDLFEDLEKSKRVTNNLCVATIEEIYYLNQRFMIHDLPIPKLCIPPEKPWQTGPIVDLMALWRVATGRRRDFPSFSEMIYAKYEEFLHFGSENMVGNRLLSVDDAECSIVLQYMEKLHQDMTKKKSLHKIVAA